MTLAADFNTISDWIGVTTLLVALGLLIVGDLRPARRWFLGVQLSVATAAVMVIAVMVIAVRFIVMV